MTTPQKLDIYIREDLADLIKRSESILASTPGVFVYGRGYALKYVNYFGAAATQEALQKMKQEFSAEGCYVNEYPPELMEDLEIEGFDTTWTE